jgi:hypothetical protein
MAEADWLSAVRRADIDSAPDCMSALVPKSKPQVQQGPKVRAS